MPSIFRIPKVQLILTLILISITAFLKYPQISTLSPFITSVGFMVLFDLIFTYARKRTFFIPYAAIATGLIMALVIHHTASWYQVAIAAGFAMGLKNFVRFSGRHIFNPAAGGLLLVGLFFQEYPAWWGASFQQDLLSFLILLSPGLVSIFRLKKHYMMLSFLLVIGIASQLASLNFSLSSLVFNTFLDPTVVFFTLTMLPEPMTSPANQKSQLLYGVFVGLVSFALSLQNTIILDPFITALLLGNLAFFKNR